MFELHLRGLERQVCIAILVPHDGLAGSVQRQVNVAVDEPGSHVLPTPVDDVGALRNVYLRARPDRGDPIPGHDDRAVLDGWTTIPVDDRGPDDGCDVLAGRMSGKHGQEEQPEGGGDGESGYEWTGHDGFSGCGLGRVRACWSKDRGRFSLLLDQFADARIVVGR